MQSKKVIIIIVLTALFLGGVFVFRPKSSTPFSCNLDKYQGTLEGLPDFGKKPIIVNSWAAWCPFCVNELPDFAVIQEELGDDITIIAVDRAESCKVTQEFIEDLNLPDNLVFLLDPDDSFYQSIGGFSMPETIFIDQNGKTIFHKRGPMEVEEIRKKTKELFF